MHFPKPHFAFLPLPIICPLSNKKKLNYNLKGKKEKIAARCCQSSVARSLEMK